TVQGLNVVPVQDLPPVDVVRFAFQTMVGTGTLLALLGVVYLYVRLRHKRLSSSRWCYRAVVLESSRRPRPRPLELDFRARALGLGLCAGTLALADLLVVRYDSPPLFHGLTKGGGAAMVGVSAAAGLMALLLVWRRYYGPAAPRQRSLSPAIVAGWSLAQKPGVLPGLTIDQAAGAISTFGLATAEPAEKTITNPVFTAGD
ncbi:MAG TPA: cytochrome ubiquinol oxidase subunit I, partial [Pseudonocardiaceae bacterium]|nr:cytochrome ubiquinol oxidase subunit I [Pseudonocardiaceae bacterium]